VRYPAVFVRERTVGERQFKEFGADRDRQLGGKILRTSAINGHDGPLFDQTTFGQTTN
jgi:hypothetical protein